MTESETPSQILTRMIKEKATSVRTFVASAGANGHKLTISAVSQLCTGKQDFSLATATACAAVLGVSPALFLPALDTIIGTQSPAPAGADETLIRLPLAHLAPSHLNPRRDFAYPEFEEQVVWLVEQALIAGSATPLTALCDGAPVPPAILDLANI
ncbi:MAG: hypothetical protein QOJ54_441, partial [Aliidongia sp.]|nr:hypothetical protein [Aliidongia sp.]